MLKELFKYITISTADYVRHMGYLKEAIAIESRHQRCRDGWDRHLQNSKDTILKAVELCSSRKKVVVLGSGSLLDLPLRELSAAFEEVFLVDIVQTPSTEMAVSVFSNVKLISADVTGIVERVYLEKPRPEENLPSPEPYLPECDSQCSLVISLNLLSQLPYIPMQYLKNKLRWNESERLLLWENEIMSSHYKALIQLDCLVCLISDWQMSYIDKKGIEIERHLTAPILQKITPYKQWTWELVPLGKESRKFSVEMTVSALLIDKKTF